MGLRGNVTAEWPQRFLNVNGTDHTLVVLYQNGEAAFSSRTTRPSDSDAYYTTSRARWWWCDKRNRSTDRCILVDVTGYDGREEASFLLQYQYDTSKLTVYDEGGPGKVLERIYGY
jgi:hypothetical protein